MNCLAPRTLHLSAFENNLAIFWWREISVFSPLCNPIINLGREKQLGNLLYLMLQQIGKVVGNGCDQTGSACPIKHVENLFQRLWISSGSRLKINIQHNILQFAEFRVFVKSPLTIPNYPTFLKTCLNKNSSKVLCFTILSKFRTIPDPIHLYIIKVLMHAKATIIFKVYTCSF